MKEIEKLKDTLVQKVMEHTMLANENKSKSSEQKSYFSLKNKIEKKKSDL